MTRSEIRDVLQTMDGGSTHATKEATEPYELLPSPLSRYVESLRGSELKTASVLAGRAMGVTSEPRLPQGTIRRWTELLFTAIEEPIFPGLTEHTLPDAVLKSIRLYSVWSAMVITPDLRKFDATRDQIVDNAWWPGRRSKHPEEVLPPSIAELLCSVTNKDARELALAKKTRLDDLECGASGMLMWALEGRRCVLSVHSPEAEEFPKSWSLNQFGWTSHMIIGIASVRAMMGALAAEAEYWSDDAVGKLAERSHRITLEMEEMFDLNISWPEYEHLYHRLRQLLGLEATYQHVRDRVELLSRQAEVVARTQQDRSLNALQIGGGLLALALLWVGILQILAQSRDVYSTASLVFGTSVTMAVFGVFLRNRRRRL